MAILLPLSLALAAPPPDVVGEAWVFAPSSADRARLREQPVGFGEGILDGWVRVLGTREELDSLVQAGFSLKDERTDHRAPAFFDGTVHSPEAMNDALALLATTHPDRTRLFEIGESAGGRPVLALEMGAPEGSSWRLLGAHHGDELSSAELMLEAARALLDGEGGFAGLLEDRQVVVVPHVNPDGVAIGSRFNAVGVDLNRNYSYRWSENEYRPGAFPFSEPESRAVRTLSLQDSFLAGLSGHSGATNLGYVWNYSEAATLDADLLESFGTRYLEACTQEGFWLTNGAAWYTTRGDTNDWSYGMLGILDYTLEVSLQKTPPQDDLEEAVADHLPGIAAWLATPTPLLGQTLDAESGEPVPALVEVLGASPPFASDPVHGGFARVLEPGTYFLRAMAPGYQVYQLDLDLQEDESFFLEVQLVRQGLSSGPVEPQLLSMGQETVLLSLPDSDPQPDHIRLVRPGVPTVELERMSGGYPVNPASLVTGPYTVVAEELAYPRAVFAGALSDRVQVESVEIDGDTLRLAGQGFGLGSRVLGLWGLERSAHELPLLSQDSDLLEVDVSGLSGGLDLWILSNGVELAVLDVLGRAGLDTAAPPDTGGWDTADADPLGRVELIPVSLCGSVPHPPSRLTALLALVVAGGLRRKKCVPPPSSP